MSWHPYFDETNVEAWDVLEFHKAWIHAKEGAFDKATDKLSKSLRSISNTSSDVNKVKKADSLLATIKDRREEINNIWLTYKKEKTILQAEQAKANLELQKISGVIQAVKHVQRYAGALSDGAIANLEFASEPITSEERNERKRPAEEVSPIITSPPNLRQRKQDEPRTPENKERGPSNVMLLRKTKKICYTESSSSDSSDLEDVKKSKNKHARSQQYVREDTPCPTIYSATSTLIATPNKPIITKSTYDEYSAHIICAFNTTIHLVKESLEEPMYEKVKNMLQMGNKLVINDSIVKKLESIFQTSYTEIESKIISETNIEDNQTSEENRFIFFIRYALLYFISKFKYLMPKVLDQDILERSYIVECLSPILQAFRNAFPDIKYMWLEKDVRSIKEANIMFASNFGERKTDLLILRLSDARELLNVEVSGPPYRPTKKHTVGDVKKLLIMAICSLCRLLGNNLDCNIEDAKNVKTYSIQVIGDRLTLFAVSLVGKRKYLAVELASCVIPFAFDAITCYMKIFNFFAVIRSEFVEQEKLQKKIRSFIPTDKCSENLREWLHLPDDDISLVTEEDMDEIFMM